MPLTLLALLIAVVGLAATAAWFGVTRRRKEEVALGIQALANMKWRDSLALLLESLHREGYPRAAGPADEAGATEFMLERGGSKFLLGYKHGTAYHLSEDNLQEFARSVRMRGGARGILATLGTIDPAALAAADAARVELLGGHALWEKLRPLVPPKLLDEVSRAAFGKSRKGLWTGAAASVIAAALVYAVGSFVGAGSGPAASATASADPASPAGANVPAANPVGAVAAAPGSAPASRSEESAMLRQLNDTARALEEVSRLSPEQLALRRREVVRQVGLVSEVASASWSAQRTLLIGLRRTDGKDKVLLDEICRLVTQYEEMRYTRIQLEPPDGSGLAVRWRLCE